jgi:hypothetical protein
MASIIKSDNGVSSGVTGIVQTADSSGQLALQTTTSSGTATTALTIDNTQVATFANTLKAPNLQGPAFSAYLTTTQSITSSTWTKVSLNYKEFDTNTNFDNATNYRFTPTVAGYYQINGCIGINGTAVTRNICSIYKNGSEYKRGLDAPTSIYQIVVSSIVYFNGTTDYVELYGYITATSLGFVGNSTTATYFNGSMLRSA